MIHPLHFLGQVRIRGVQGFFLSLLSQRIYLTIETLPSRLAIRSGRVHWERRRRSARNFVLSLLTGGTHLDVRTLPRRLVVGS